MTRVVDGDTVDVKLTSGLIRVRLNAIDAPEKGQPWGAEATRFLTGKLNGVAVDIEPISQDRYHRMVAVIHAGDVNVNSELVRLGYAWAYRQYMRKADSELCNAEAEARQANRGFWKLPVKERLAPWEYRARKKRNTFTDYSRETVAACMAAMGKRPAQGAAR